MFEISGTLEFSHFGLAVSDFEKAKRFFVYMHYDVIKSEFDKQQNIVATLLENASQPSIELISKLRKDDKTPIDNIIKDNSSAFYHLCYKCADIDLCLKNIIANDINIRQISKIAYSPLFNSEISFYITDSIGLIEIIHT